MRRKLLKATEKLLLEQARRDKAGPVPSRKLVEAANVLAALADAPHVNGRRVHPVFDYALEPDAAADVDAELAELLLMEHALERLLAELEHRRRTLEARRAQWST